jgi:DNA repair protein RadC
MIFRADLAERSPRLRSRIPNPESPARRLRELGAPALGTAELLCLLLEPGRGNEKALHAAKALATRYPGPEGGVRLRSLASASVAELARVAGLSEAAAARLLASFELGRRVVEEQRPERERVHNARAIYEVMRLRLRDRGQEEFHVLLLNTQNQLLRDVTIAVGTADMALVHPRDVFKCAMSENATALVLVHNHPSGEPSPSPEDRAITEQLATAGQMLSLPVMDHVIIGEGRYYSFKEAGYIT